MDYEIVDREDFEEGMGHTHTTSMDSHIDTHPSASYQSLIMKSEILASLASQSQRHRQMEERLTGEVKKIEREDIGFV